MPEGYCYNCMFNRGLSEDYVKCSSLRHARFMDMYDNTFYRRCVKTLGWMMIKSTDVVRITCSDHKVKGA